MLDRIPKDVLVYHVLVYLDGQSLQKLSLVSKYLYSLVNQEQILWKKLCNKEFNISQDSAYRNHGWKRFYQALKHRTEFFIWGENSDGRLGLDSYEPVREDSEGFLPIVHPRRRIGTVNRIVNRPSRVITPAELPALRHKSIIDITVGGWSFHALDTQGYVWTWGAMQRDTWLEVSLGTNFIREPSLLQTGDDRTPKIRFKTISSGRCHVIGLAIDGSVWHWSNAIYLQKVQIRTDSRIDQVVGNWRGSSLLTQDGTLYVVPNPDFVPDGVRVCPEPTVVDMIGIKAADLGFPEDKIVQLAGLSEYTLVLTQFGRVLKVKIEDGNELMTNPSSCVTELIRFGSQGLNEMNDRNGMMKRFVTGTYEHFAVYTKDRVMIGTTKATNHTEPIRIPELDNQDICKISFGDYHYGALTNDGQLFTWGNFSSGALGQGKLNGHSNHPPKLVENLNDKFIFNIGFGGWQSTALVIDKDLS